MGLRFKLNWLPWLRPGEKVLFFKKWVWFCSGSSFPNYRVFFSMPPLWEAGLYVTDRRVLFICHVFRLLTEEFSQWFEGKGEPRDSEFIKEVNVGKNWLFGPYLEVISENPGQKLYRSSRAVSRLYMKNAASVHKMIVNMMAQKNPKKIHE